MPMKVDRDIQNKIFDLIEKNPGIYLSKIADLLPLDVSKVQFYLDQMEQQQLITSSKVAGVRQYYIDDRRISVHSRKIQQIRRRICDVITKNPGIYLSRLAEELNMRVSLAEYHLMQLEKQDIITAVKEGGYRRYYMANSDIGTQEKRIVPLLRQKIPLKIVLLLLQKSPLQHKELQEELEVAPSTLSYHLNKLLTDGILDVRTHGDQKGYSISDRKLVTRFLVKYKLHEMVEGMDDIWEDISYSY